MFIRWKTRTEVSRADDRLAAEILESRRINGKPCHKSVLYLGGIKRRHIEIKDWCERYWRKVDVKLSRLNLSPEQRQKIEAAILRVVPRDKRLKKEQDGMDLRYRIDAEKESIRKKLDKLCERLDELERERVRLSDLLRSEKRQ